MNSALAAIEATSLATYLRGARWGYAAVSGTHVFGIALLVGAIIPLDLRLAGLWRSIPHTALARVLVPVAASGLALAIASGLALFSVRAGEYASLDVFGIKLALVGTGLAAALAIHLRHGFVMTGITERTARTHAVLSATCWLGALACGRLIAFAG